MGEVPQISESEWEIMSILWSNGPLTSRTIIEELPHDTGWQPKTVRTFIRRLVDKGAVGFRKKGRTYEYYPLVGQEECRRAETRSFLQRVYGGAIKPLLVHFIEEERLSQKDIEELKRILGDRAGE